MSERPTISASDVELAEGQEITWLGTRVGDMTRQELIAFIWQLDHQIGLLTARIPGAKGGAS